MSRIDGIKDTGLSTALEWVIGDTRALAWDWFADGGVAPAGRPDNANRTRLDITGNAIGLVFEYYHAAVTPAAGRAGGASVGVSGLRIDSTRTTVTVAGAVDADQSTNPGRFEWTMPADIYADPQPAADETEAVPVAVVYATRSIGAVEFTARFLVVFRRGKP
ncbi:MAG: hypothetical protein OXC08_11840 [Thiotrichales bacterium]|nr:hypothetical protein [Thiotrichales bacterium]